MRVTRQMVYDRVKKHLLDQNVRSVDGTGRCMYRGPEGRMCALGCLIPDSRYAPSLEAFGSPYSSEIQMAIFGRPTTNLGGAMMRLLKYLQAIHDYSFPSRWEDQLHGVACQEGLTP